MTITKAIIPVAGWGTRRLPITKAIEKCMLPVGNRPLVDYVVQDCVRAGIRDIYFVVSEESQQIKTYYGQNASLEAYLSVSQKDELLPLVRPMGGVQFHYVTQGSSAEYGTAIPVGLVVPQIGEGESAIVLMGDDFIYNADGSSEVARLLAATPEGGNSMLGVQMAPEQLSRYGVIQTDEQHNFLQIVEKPAAGQAPSNMINVSKYVLNHDLLSAIQHYSDANISGEYHITEPINQYILGGGSLKVVPAEGRYLDGGNVHSWLYANEVVMGRAA